MNDAVKHALDRWRLGYADSEFGQMTSLSDAVIMAQAFVDSHPADADEPLTAEWLCEVLHGTWIAFGERNCFRLMFRCLDDFLELHVKGPAKGDTLYQLPLPHIETRGQFRDLCRVLGVTLKENGDAD